MSLASMILKANTHVDIVYVIEAVTAGTGGQLSKTWKVRYPNVPARMRALTSQEKQLYYEQAHVFPEFICYIEHYPGVLDSDKIKYNGRYYMFKKSTNPDMQDKFMAIALMEIA